MSTILDRRTYEDRVRVEKTQGYERKNGIRLKKSTWEFISNCPYSLPQIIELGVKVAQELMSPKS